MDNDDGAILYIDGHSVVSHNGAHDIDALCFHALTTWCSRRATIDVSPSPTTSAPRSVEGKRWRLLMHIRARNACLKNFRVFIPGHGWSGHS